MCYMLFNFYQKIRLEIEHIFTSLFTRYTINSSSKFVFQSNFFQILETIFMLFFLFSLPIFEVYNDSITEYQSCYLISAANSSRTFVALGPISLALASYYGAGRNFIFIMDIVFLSHTPYLYSMHWDSSYHRYTAARWSIAEKFWFTLCVFEITFSLNVVFWCNLAIPYGTIM